MAREPATIARFKQLCGEHARWLGRGYRGANALHATITADFDQLAASPQRRDLLALVLRGDDAPAATWAGILLVTRAMIADEERLAVIARLRASEKSERSLVGAMIMAFLMDHGG